MPRPLHTENTLIGAIEALSETERLVAPSGFTPSHMAVLQLLSVREGLGNCAIGEALGLSAPTVSRLVERLGAVGLVRTSIDPTDLRRNLFRLEVQAHAILFELRKSLLPHGLDEALALQSALARTARQTGISPAACRVAAASPQGGATVGELSRAAGLRQSSTSTALKALAVAHMMQPMDRGGEQDGRCRRYTLTHQGKLLQDTVRACYNSIVNENSFAN